MPVRILGATVTDAVMPKEDPGWRFALGARPESLGLVLRLETDEGLVGYGYGSEIPHLGYPFGAFKATVELLAQKVVGRDPLERGPLLASLENEARGFRPAFAVLELALYDLAARALAVPVYQLLGGAFRRDIPVLRILPLKEPERVAESAVRLVERGYRYLKIKLDGDLDTDASRVAAVRRTVGDGVHLTVDANQSYTAKGAIDFYRRVERYRIDLFEQPVRWDDFRGLAAVTRAIDCTVEADESADSLEAIYRLGEMAAVDAISLKVLKLGGLDAMREAAALCRLANLRCRVGATVGSRLLNAAAMHFVAATPNIDYACEVGEFERLRSDPFEGIEVIGGSLTLPEEPGFGVRPVDGGTRP